MRHVVALSGGKDSTALSLRLAEVEPRDYVYVCTPTSNEPPEMAAHWAKLGELLGKPIICVAHELGLNGLIFKQKALPNWRQRWCTRILKIEPYAQWLTQNAPCVSYVGLRADEAEREGGDYLCVPGVEMRFPMREWGWTEPDVLAYLKQREITIPKRTDCLVCFYQRLIEWYEFWHAAYVEGIEEYRKAWDAGEAQEEFTGHTFRSPGRDTWPASMAGLRMEFESGRAPKDTRKDQFGELKCRVCRM